MADVTPGGEALPGQRAAAVGDAVPEAGATPPGPQPEEGGQEQPSFEEALEELAAIVRALETGEHGLDRSLELFQRGIALARLCHRRLDEIERKIEWLLEDEEGRPYTAPAHGLLEEAADR
ncbi:MAG: exodeoxyribonuclease VII small subunit [Bacillota bacterium]|nr:MAG: exodeoxyribonuclease VII small subunit [Bacillota bacterium]